MTIDLAELHGLRATLKALDAELTRLRSALAEARAHRRPGAAPTQPLPRIWVQIPLCATALEYGVDDTWFHVPCQRYFQSALHHDCGAVRGPKPDRRTS